MNKCSLCQNEIFLYQIANPNAEYTKSYYNCKACNINVYLDKNQEVLFVHAWFPQQGMISYYKNYKNLAHGFDGCIIDNINDLQSFFALIKKLKILS